jgi:hypothetical protein
VPVTRVKKETQTRKRKMKVERKETKMKRKTKERKTALPPSSQSETTETANLFRTVPIWSSRFLPTGAIEYRH